MSVRSKPPESTDVKLHCSCFPLILTPLGLVEDIQSKYGVGISCHCSRRHVRPDGLIPIADLRDAFGGVTPMLKLLDIRHYSTSQNPIVVEFQWEACDDHGQYRPVHERVSWHLNNAFYLSEQRSESFIHDSTHYTADLKNNPSTLTETSTEVVRKLRKVTNPSKWSYLLPEGGDFVPHTDADSAVIEQMYRYGGDHVALAGIKHTIDFVSATMCQIDLEKGGDRVPLKRFPLARLPAAHPLPSLPDYRVKVKITGEKAEAAKIDPLPSLPDYRVKLRITGEKAEAAKIDLQQKVESLLQTVDVVCKLPESLSQQQQEDVLVYMHNVARQYCIQVHPQPIKNHTISIGLKGVRRCIDEVDIHLRKQSLDIQQNMLSRKPTVVAVQPQPALNVCFVNISEGSEEWNRVLKRMRVTLPEVKIVQLVSVHNRPLKDKYDLEKRQMSERNHGVVNEYKLFHGTRNTEPQMVVSSVKGIDFRYSARDRKLLWGTGAYFAVNANYSDRFSYPLGIYKQLLLVKVLTGQSYSYGNTHNPHLTKPPSVSPGVPYDTVNGSSHNSLVYVVYDHDKAYPEYVITYQS